MIFGIVIAILFLAIVFFHYLQGLFSSTLSAIIAVIAAVLAFSWHEMIVEKLLQDKFANISNSLVLVLLFAILYTILRVIFDKMIPGAILFPAIVDRVGGALMGAIAAIFGLGIFSIAAEELPLGPSIAGYVKYATTDRPAQVLSTGTGTHQQEGNNFDELNSDAAGRFDEGDRKNLFPWIVCGADDAVVNTVGHLSEGGSLAGDQPLDRIHPDFLQELFAQRLGIQVGAEHSTFSLPKKPAMTVADVFTVSQVRVSDPEYPGVRPTPPKVVPPLEKVREIVHSIKSPKGEVIGAVKTQVVGPGTDPDNRDKEILLVVRLQFGTPAADTEDSNIRFSPGAVRLVANKMDASGNLHPCDYYPLGTVEAAGDWPVLYEDKLDDFLIVPLRPAKGEGLPAVDLLYAVDAKGFLAGDKIDPNVFLEFKRLDKVSLAGKQTRPWVKDAPGLVVRSLIKVPAVELSPSDAGYVSPAINPAGPAGTPPVATGAAQPTKPGAAPPVVAPVPVVAGSASPLPPIQPGAIVNFPGGPSGTIVNFILIAQTPELPVKISVPAAEKNKTLISIPRILEATLKNGQFQELTVNPQATLAELAGNGDLPVDQFFVPKNKVAWQIIGDATLDPFEWLRKTPTTSLIDSTGAETKPFGCWSVINNGAAYYLYSRYNPNYPLDNDSINPVPTVGKEFRIAVIFLLPPGATPAQLKIDANTRDVKPLRTVTSLK